MCHIHTSIVFMHLATRGNNKIMCTPPPQIISSEEILPRRTRRTLAQLWTNKSPFLKSYLHKVDAKSHQLPLCPHYNTHIHNTHHLFNCTHIRTTLSSLDLWADPAGVTALLARWVEMLTGGQQAVRSDPPPHTSKGHGSGLTTTATTLTDKCWFVHMLSNDHSVIKSDPKYFNIFTYFYFIFTYY